MESENAMRTFTRLVVASPMCSFLHKLRVAPIALACCLASQPSIAEIVDWPELPKTCFVSQRPANVEDVRKGCAAFLIGGPERSVGMPLNVQIPEYAYHVDSASGKKTPVILLQAEEHSSIKAVGYREVGTSSIGAALLSEMQLLGTSKPR
ncbi:hypothetical protein BamMC406_1217 [Burkholderia ambifaria MC40-6]|uniref:Uncharacterized protein n=1 Tax=Burkholderia ambifaria (strain MC40-6) TaxID=398577 RepID=B1YMZ4_BURA4|nr:hypothetical protein BamMC406_1217 [Burkholderia ambifaria MC40-6]